MDEIIKSYNIIENFKLILDKFFLKNSKIISEQLIHNILRIIVIILEISQEGMNKILSNKFLELISDIINTEFKSDINNNNNFNNDNSNNNIINLNIIPLKSNNNKRFSTFSSEFFDIMNALFPKSYNIYLKKNIDDKKILKPENKAYYDFFCNSIFLPLINNVMKKSMNILCNNYIKLISSFILNATKDDIILYLPSKPISQIIIKLLDTKKYSLVNDSVNLIKCLLDKSPENYIVSFVREGIIENLKNLKLEESERKRERIPLRKLGLSFFDKDFKIYKKEREKYIKKKRDLLVKIKRNRKKLNNILELKDKSEEKNKIDNNNNNNKEDNNNNEIIIKEEDNKEKEKEKEVPNNNNEIKEEKESINKNKEIKEIKEIPKDEKVIELERKKKMNFPNYQRKKILKKTRKMKTMKMMKIIMIRTKIMKKKRKNKRRKKNKNKIIQIKSKKISKMMKTKMKMMKKKIT